MSARGQSAIITYDRDHFNKFQRHTPSSCRRQQFFEIEKNAGKIMITNDKPRERTSQGEIFKK